MQTIRKIASFTLAAFFLTACGTSSNAIADYSNAAISAYSELSSEVETMLDELNAELDKGDQMDFARLEKIFSEKSANAKTHMATIRGLTPPDAPGVKEFSSALEDLVKVVEDILKLNDDFLTAIKAKDSKKISEISPQLLKKFETIVGLEEKVIETQKQMAEKNNLQLE